MERTPDPRSRLSVSWMIAVATVGLLALAPTVAAHSTSGSGTITAGNPTISASETLAPCSPGGTFDDVDAEWWDIAGFGDGEHFMVLQLDATLDADAEFYDASCGFIGTGEAATSCASFRWPETCIVPDGAAYVAIRGWLGTGSYSFTID